MPEHNGPTYRVGSLSHVDAQWFLLAVQTAAEFRYPAGIPRGVAELLGRARKTTEAATQDLEDLCALLCIEGTEGVEGPALGELDDDWGGTGG